jgi:hypothetical protein
MGVEQPRGRAQMLSAKVEKLIARKNATVLSDAWSKLRADVDDDAEVRPSLAHQSTQAIICRV